MKIALVICPYFTNGENPPLGLACLNGALRAAGHETACFDLIHRAYRDHLGELGLLRHLANLWRTADDEVLFTLNPRLVVSFLLREDYPDFSFETGLPAEDEPMEAMLYLGIKAACMMDARAILAEKPGAVFFSVFASNTLWSLMLAKEIKKSAPGLPVFFGGPGVGLPELMRFFLSLGPVDAVSSGDGEPAAVEIARDPAAALSGAVEGVAVLQSETLIHTPRKPVPLAGLPAPSFGGFPLPGHELARYRDVIPNKWATSFFYGLPVYSSRGCVNRCAFCSETAYWRGYRLREAGVVCEEIRRNLGLGFGRETVFGDSAVNGNMKWFREFLSLMAPHEGRAALCGYMMARPEIDGETGRDIYRAGFRWVTLGTESFSASLRARMNKGYNGDELFGCLLSLTRAGVNVAPSILVGFPGEAEEEYRESLDFLERFSRLAEAERGPGRIFWDAGYPIRLEAYSDMYNHPEKFGIEIFPGKVPPLPRKLEHLVPAWTPLFRKWTAPGRENLEERCRRVREKAASSG